MFEIVFHVDRLLRLELISVISSHTMFMRQRLYLLSLMEQQTEHAQRNRAAVGSQPLAIVSVLQEHEKD